MSLSEAIARNVAPLTAAQTTYLADVINVTSAAAAVAGTPLPVLNNPPANWQDFVSVFDQAKASAGQWSSDVWSELYNAPGSIMNNNSLISQLLTSCSSYATSLQSNTDPAVLAALKTDLSLVNNQLGVVNSIISQCQSAVSTFNNNLPTLVQQLQAVVTDFTNQENVDQQAIASFQADINQLYSDIQDQAQKIVDASLAIAAAGGVAIFVGATAGWTPAGVLVGLFCLAVIGAAAFGIDMAVDAIKADKLAISNDTAQMNTYTADVATCLATVKNFNAFLSEMDSVKASVQAVLDQWNTLEADVKAAITDISAATDDVGSASYTAALADIANASTEWNAIDQLASSLVLNISYSSAVADPGMTPDQVSQAVSAAPSTPITQYLTGGSGSGTATASVGAMSLVPA